MPATVAFTFVHPSLDGGELEIVLPATTSIDTLKGVFGDTIGVDASTIDLSLSLVATATSSGTGKQSALATLIGECNRVQVTISSLTAAPVAGQKRSRLEYAGSSAAAALAPSNTDSKTRLVAETQKPAASAQVAPGPVSAEKAKMPLGGATGSCSADASPGPTSTWTIFLQGIGPEIAVKVLPTTPFNKIVRAYSEKRGIPQHTLRFNGGQLISWQNYETVEDNGLQDNDTVDVWVTQSGD